MGRDAWSRSFFVAPRHGISVDSSLMSVPSMLLSLLLMLSSFATTPASARRPAPAPCPTGLFAVRDTPPFPGAGLLLLDASGIAFDAGCTDRVAATIKATRKRTKISARWASCTDLPAGAKLKAVIASPACDALTGAVVAKKTKPKRRKLAAARLGPTELVTTLTDVDTQKRMLNENFPYLIRIVAEPYNPELRELIALGPAAVDRLLEQFGKRVTLADDIPLSLFAYALERIGDPRAVPVLAEWLDRNLFASTIWATDFVTHTIKVLDGQGGLASDFIYDTDEKLDTIARTLHHIATSQALTVASRLVTSIPESKNKCGAVIYVTGINAAGQQETVKIGYTTLFYDLPAQIELESDPAVKAILSKQLANYKENDEKNYGGSDYRAIGDVSIASNCGGSVTENILNNVAAQRGFPVHLGSGNASADEIRDLANKFGGPVPASQLDPFSVIAHERPESGTSVHVEVPLSVNGDSVVVFSKDNQGAPRLHTIDKGHLANDAFTTIQQLYNFRPFGLGTSFEATEPKFYRVDPSRILDIRLDTSACPCEALYGGVIPLEITQPTESTTPERVLTVGGTVGDPDVRSGNLRVNGSAQGLAVSSGAFSSQVVLASGDNRIRVAVDGPDGRRGCAEKTIKSETPKTTLSVTLTWDLQEADVDLYVTQPDQETAWYSAKDTTIGGRLDVDNTGGIGPENYFLSSEEGDTILTGSYAIRVHYYADHQATTDVPTRPVTWRVTFIVNEGTPDEKRDFKQGVIATANSGNATPGSSGTDWADVAAPTL
jgi:uncharacterized protein YfaP (DUF2135 family)